MEQLDYLSTKYLEKIEDKTKPFAINILHNLYVGPTIGLTAQDILNFFFKDNRDFIKNIIAYLEQIYLIRQIICNKNEKRYVLTEFGENAILDFYNS